MISATFSLKNRLVLAFILATVHCAVAAQVLVQGPKHLITLEDIEAELAMAPRDVRAQVLGDAQQLRSVARNLYIRKGLGQLALASGIDKDAAVQKQLAIARDKVLQDAYLKQLTDSKQPSADALEAYARSTYAARPERFEVKERVKVSHIFMRGSDPDTRARMEQLRLKALAGEAFDALAKENSQDTTSATKGGSLGIIERSKTMPQFEEAAFSLTQKGQISELVETTAGLHIIRLDEKLPAGRRPYEEVKDTLTAEAAQQLRARIAQTAVDEVLESGEVNNKAILEAVQNSRK